MDVNAQANLQLNYNNGPYTLSGGIAAQYETADFSQGTGSASYDIGYFYSPEMSDGSLIFGVKAYGVWYDNLNGEPAYGHEHGLDIGLKWTY